MSAARDEFYVGYLPQAPTALGRWLRGSVLAALVLVGALGWLLSSAHDRRPAALFEYGAPVELSGTILCDPYPRLLVERPGAGMSRAGVSSNDASRNGMSSYSLVAPFKHGADELVAAFEGSFVSLRATLAYRDGQVMAEIEPGSIRKAGQAARPPAAEESLGTHTLAGEIVDSKCFFGVMNPGEAKPHRACAVRCISGGIPPVLCVRSPTGQASYFVLVSETGEALGRELLELVAEPVQVTGEVSRSGDILVLRADADAYRRLE